MIGVISRPEEREVVEEFFQLFKTPWEFYHPDRRYDVVIATAQELPEVDSPLFLVFGTEKCRLDEVEGGEAGTQGPDVFIGRGNVSLPIYGKAITFSTANQPILQCSGSKQIIGYETRKGEQRILRIGYDLFKEVSYLLSVGQPAQNALIPTLDLHIEMLRNWIVDTGIPLIEVPPAPGGYRFIACLTHDIDFIGIRRHFFDHSVRGFLYRSTAGSLRGFMKRRVSLQKLQQNLKAALSLPFVSLGICLDPWDQFDRCLDIERGVRSTFFFMPFKNKAGLGFSKGRGKQRAAKYDIGDAEDIIQKLRGHGCEIGVHGIDAWHSVDAGEQELHRVQEKAASQDGIGIRIHWLSRNEQTFEILDKAGYSYDSTFGYNETVGFKAGTGQAFKPVGARNLLEIPLHIQDSALFLPGRMDASESRADHLCQKIIDHASLVGGVLTILWHQRSLGPERLWGDFYEGLVSKLRQERVWFASAAEVAEWFRMRRSVKFEEDRLDKGKIRITFELAARQTLPGLVLRHFKANKSGTRETLPIIRRLQQEDAVLLKEQSHRLAP